MSSQVTSSPYMLLFRGTHWDRNLSPEEIEKIMSQCVAWFDRLIEQGKATTGQPLANEGKIISGRKGQFVADGPFAESKEAIAGYIFLQVGDLEEAVEIGKEWPGLDYGVTVEVRPVNEQIGRRFRQRK